MLLAAIRKVHAGEAWIDRKLVTSLLQDARRALQQRDPEQHKITDLTVREREIVALVAQGHGTRQLAARLGIADKTIRNHLVSIYAKLGVSDRLELAIYAGRHGLAGTGERSGAEPGHLSRCLPGYSPHASLARVVSTASSRRGGHLEAIQASEGLRRPVVSLLRHCGGAIPQRVRSAASCSANQATSRRPRGPASRITRRAGEPAPRVLRGTRPPRARRRSAHATAQIEAMRPASPSRAARSTCPSRSVPHAPPACRRATCGGPRWRRSHDRCANPGRGNRARVARAPARRAAGSATRCA